MCGLDGGWAHDVRVIFNGNVEQGFRVTALRATWFHLITSATRAGSGWLDSLFPFVSDAPRVIDGQTPD